MRILVTNDDGVSARELWVLVEELNRIAQVVVVAPDREQSAIGTAVTLHQPVRVHEVEPAVLGVKTYSVEGTPGDSVALALGKLVEGRVDVVVSGINRGLNLGDDVFISGTVGAAQYGYLCGIPALAISMDTSDSPHLDNAARLAALLAERISGLPASVFLNVNLPNVPLSEVKGVKITQLASTGYAGKIEPGHDGRREYYWLVHDRANRDGNNLTDIWAVAHGYISITPLQTDRAGEPRIDFSGLSADLFTELVPVRNG